MAELTPEEKLQPSLLDRLTDDAPEKRRESRDKRVLSLDRLREGVLRDLGCLLNSSQLGANEDLEEFPLAAHSVINYGMPDLAGIPSSGIDSVMLERMLRQVIVDFEPRIMRDSVKVRILQDEDAMSHNALTFEIEGELWAEPSSLHLLVKSEVDLESGDVTIEGYDAY